MDLRGKIVLVLGIGETGLSMAKWLSRCKATVRAADTRLAPPRLAEFRQSLPEARIYEGGFDAEAFSGVDLIGISPGVPLSEPLVRRAVANGVPVVGDMELFALALQTMQQEDAARPGIIGITGSNGKTTVTAMVGAMARKAGWDVEVAGNIGPAVLDAWMRRQDMGRFPRAWVLEMSSFQLETTRSLFLDAATVLNVTEDHLDRYASMEDYAAAKAGIFLKSGPSGEREGVQVINRDDPLVRAMGLSGRKQVTFGCGMPAREEDYGLLSEGNDIWLVQGKKRLMKASELAVTGRHNATNALAALALCRALALPLEPLLEALREFRGLPHRMEKVAVMEDVTFYDDSKGTNVGATVAALNGLSQTVVLIAGGDGKGQDFSPLAGPVARHARAVVLIGRDAKNMAAALERGGVPLYFASNMEEAVQQGFVLSKQGDAVLLSPACASLDMFRNYVHRSEVFVAAVRALPKGAR
ncbi:MAG: UDP-N-acetylmuramoylalanine--D-glutamate ligase [Nitrosospira sp.]